MAGQKKGGIFSSSICLDEEEELQLFFELPAPPFPLVCIKLTSYVIPPPEQTVVVVIIRKKKRSKQPKQPVPAKKVEETYSPRLSSLPFPSCASSSPPSPPTTIFGSQGPTFPPTPMHINDRPARKEESGGAKIGSENERLECVRNPSWEERLEENRRSLAFKRV